MWQLALTGAPSSKSRPHTMVCQNSSIYCLQNAKALSSRAEYDNGKAVRRIRFIAALLVLAAWVPATSHCLWTGAGLIPGSCHTEHHHGDGPAHSHDHCGQCVLESGSFKLTEKDGALFSFIALCAWQISQPAPLQEADLVFRVDSGRAPPDLTTHHFQTRAALPGRAPALL